MRDAGFLLLQIDGLAHEELRRAMRLHFTPYLRSLVRRRGYVFGKWRAGLPSTTPAFQAALLYGIFPFVPGLRWFDKRAGAVRTMKNVLDLWEVESTLARRAPGILRGGSSYGNFFSGGAERTAFTASRTDFGSVAATIPWRELLPLVLRNLDSFLRVVALSFYEGILELYDELAALIRSQPRRGEEMAFLIERIIASAVMRELTALAVETDLRQGRPYIYANFGSYDAMAHHRGPRSLHARFALSGIDRKLASIERVLSRRAPRSYDLFIFSDHGQTPTWPFDRHFRKSLREWVVERTLHPEIEILGEEERRALISTLAFLSALREVRGTLPRLAQGVLDFFARRLERRVRQPERWLPAAEIALLPTSGLAHLYFRASPEALPLEEVEARWPNLLPGLTALPGVRALAARSSRGAVIRGARGEVLVAREITVHGDNPLDGAGPFEAVAREIESLLATPGCGDLLLFAGKLPEEGHRRRPRYLNFQNEFGGHGALEPPEQEAFIIYPGPLESEMKDVRNALDFHRFLASYQEASPPAATGRHPPGAEAGEAGPPAPAGVREEPSGKAREAVAARSLALPELP